MRQVKPLIEVNTLPFPPFHTTMKARLINFTNLAELLPKSGLNFTSFSQQIFLFPICNLQSVVRILSSRVKLFRITIILVARESRRKKCFVKCLIEQRLSCLTYFLDNVYGFCIKGKKLIFLQFPSVPSLRVISIIPFSVIDPLGISPLHTISSSTEI